MDPQEVCALHRKNRYDLILLDLQMPGMDGFQVMEGLKTNDGRRLPAGAGDHRAARPQAARAAGRRQGLHQQAVRPGRGQDAHPQHAGSAAAVQEARDYNKLLEQTVQERTAELRESEARFRSLTELASDWYWEQDENGDFTKVSGPVLEMLGIRVEPLAGTPAVADDADGWNEAERAELRATIAARQPFLDFVFSRVNADGSTQQFRVSGRADVQPVLPLHRLPRHRHGNHARTTDARDADIHAMAAAAQPAAEPSARRPAGRGLRAPGAASGTGADAARRHALRAGRPVAPRLLPHHRHRVAALRDGVGRIGRDRGRGQRRHRRRFAVHGRRHHAQLGRGADRRPRLPAGPARAEAGVRPRRPAAAPAAALHPGADDADGADRSLQPAPFGGAAAVPLAAADAGPLAVAAS